MQEAKARPVFEKDLSEAVSDLKTEGYAREIENAQDLAGLDIVGHKTRTDFQLTRNDRFELLAEVEHATALAGKGLRESPKVVVR